MTARILLVDDIEMNLRVLEARLSAEYYDVVTAMSGADALDICRSQPIDLVLLDVMMPEMDGFEVCRRLKADPRTMYLPIVLITALDQPSDRLAGLEAGADDFLTKPVRDLPLFSRVRSLTRLKLVTDELRRRAETAINLVGAEDTGGDGREPLARLAFYGEDADETRRIQKHLKGIVQVETVADAAGLIAAAVNGAADAVLVDMAAKAVDPLRLVSQLRSNEASRLLPVLAIAAADDDETAARALELGANDYIQRPLDRHELIARIRTQMRRKRNDERLRQSVEQTIELALSDSLTGLHNRRFFETHLATAVQRARTTGASFSVLIADIDHFKRVNDGWGHEAGDRVLKQFSARLSDCLRSSDLACRFGGEEFAILMMDADFDTAMSIADRIRRSVCETPFDIGGESIDVTVSEGFAVFDAARDDALTLVRRADQALYAAKRGGRNRVGTAAAA
ncbi:MAG TPA: PleD family two-component system response regulator [Aurantimonas sp.]|uniref:diguanylate cyclase n=1 Tax=Aurantimonas marianensis TaxID=2920428 RepID=A0A9X2KHC1_9HYPH|nr:PleD family two-component system response regulator [Aurantimonas marianensis]MCP3054522.1 PleD family two-component system response regulator [Aurantimonas marianensis]